jgi:IclR family transcriptional regulator, KDG regulon repressor
MARTESPAHGADRCDSSRKPPKYILGTVQKAFNILDLFVTRPTLSFTELRDALHLNKTTLFRLLFTLEHNHYLVRDEHGRYRLGINAFVLGNSFSRESLIRRVATPHLTALSKRIGMTVQMGFLEGTAVVILQKIDPPSSIKMFSRVGAVVPAHCTGQGKTLLAYSPKEKVGEIITTHGLTRYTPHTITTAKELFRELQAIRKRGYTIDNSEHEKHIRCVAAPVLNEQNAIEVALSITGTVMDFPDDDTIARHAALLQETAERIRKELRFS